MSLFLGPIHYLMQARILFTDAQTKALLELARRENFLSAEAVEQLNETYPAASDDPLETIIDTSNIHGWLSVSVSGAERRYARTAALILQDHPERLAALEQALEELGKETAFPEVQGADEAWKLLQQRLLDGMPCDFPFQVTEESAEAVRWQLRDCPHAAYFAEVPGGAKTFYELRAALVKGLLCRSPQLRYVIAENDTFAVQKG